MIVDDLPLPKRADDAPGAVADEGQRYADPGGAAAHPALRCGRADHSQAEIRSPRTATAVGAVHDQVTKRMIYARAGVGSSAS